MNLAQRADFPTAWPPLPVAQTGKVRLDEARNQGRQFDVVTQEERPKGQGPESLLLARYGFARAVLDPTLFALPASAEAEEDTPPDFSGRKRYADTLSDRQLALTPGEVLDLRI